MRNARQSQEVNRAFGAIVLTITALAWVNAWSQPEEPVLVDVFRSGTGGYHTYRIPALLVARSGTVLAFAEGRSSPNDHARNDIVLKRSRDNGDTWSHLIIAAEDGDNSLNNPCAVSVRENSRILLMFQRYPRGKPERGVKPGLNGDDICRNFLSQSDDDGVTWSTPHDITAATKRPHYVTSIASGPGNGIQLQHGPRAGRILMPFNQGPWGEWRVYAVYSDDGGETWSMGKTAREGSPGVGNEVQLIELADGRVLLNARSHEGAKLRKTATSSNGGLTWSPLVDVPDLPEPQCNGSIARVEYPSDNTPGVIAYTGPASQTERVEGTVFLSEDEGETWPLRRTLVKGHFGYSSTSLLSDGTIGCLYEGGEQDFLERITLIRFTPDWLRAKEQ